MYTTKEREHVDQKLLRGGDCIIYILKHSVLKTFVLKNLCVCTLLCITTKEKRGDQDKPQKKKMLFICFS